MSYQDKAIKYLGDGVYLGYDGYHLILSTIRYADGSNAGMVEHVIFLDPSVWASMKMVAAEVLAAATRPDAPPPIPAPFGADFGPDPGGSDA